MSYTNLAAALARAKERSGATSADDAYLTELLQLSAGADATGATHYRCFYVAAKWLEQNRAQQTLSEAKGGTKFTGLAKPIASLMQLQMAYDTAQGLTIPKGMEAVQLGLPRLMRFQGTQSQPTQIQP